MKVGSRVKVSQSFEDLRKIYGLPYPEMGDVLTISEISEHPNIDCQKMGIVLLKFKEIPDLPGICDKTPNFLEITFTESN